MPDPYCVNPDAGAYALGLLEPDELVRYERHLRGCARCTRTVAGLAPLVHLLGEVDAESMLGATDPAFDRAAPVIQLEPLPPAERARTRPPLRRLAFVAAAATVLVLVGFVTFIARSSERGPLVAASEAPPPATVAAAPATSAAAPPRAPDPTVKPRPPTRTATSRPADAPPPRTRPAPSSTTGEPGTLSKAGAGGEYTGSNPQTGASARVDLTSTGSGTDITVEVRGVTGPRDCALRITTTWGASSTPMRWRLPAGDGPSLARGSTTVDAAGMDRVDVLDSAGGVLVSVPVNSR